jgi:hypothetical protein
MTSSVFSGSRLAARQRQLCDRVDHLDLDVRVHRADRGRALLEVVVAAGLRGDR